MEDFLSNHLVKYFADQFTLIFMPSYDETSSALFFETQCIFHIHYSSNYVFWYTEDF